jgi:hypothetical protein
VQLHRPEVLRQLALLGARLVVISMSPLSALSDWVPWFEKHFMATSPGGWNDPDAPGVFDRTCFVSDPERMVYRAYGLGNLPARRVYSLKIRLQYLLWAMAGRPIRKSLEDKLQQGGDFVVGRDGRLTLSYTGHDQSDRPSSGEILAALRKGVSGT